MSTSSVGTSNRIIGMSSGMDTEALVQAMLAQTQSKVDRQYQSKTKLEWTRDAYREVNTTLKNFRSSYMSVLNADSNMLSTSAYKTYSVDFLSDSKAVSIKAESAAQTGKVTIQSIERLAQAAQAQSGSRIITSDGDLAKPLSEVSFAQSLEFEDDEISFSINGETFTFSKDTTLSNIISTVNGNSQANVRMSYSSLTGGLTISSRSTGSQAKVDIVNLKGNAFTTTKEDPDHPGETVTTAGAFGIAAGEYKGVSAKLTINGVEVERDSNTFTIDGINYSLKDTSESEVSFTVQQDVDAVVDRVKTFVKAYNEMLDTLQSKLTEKIKFDYDPLTEEQKDAMEEDEIEDWEQAAKSGLLRNDTTISGMLSTMRSALYSEVTGTGISPSSIGLSTGDWRDQGKITLDESKLRTALQENPDAVASVFTNVSTATDAQSKFDESGLITRLSNAMNQCTSQLSSVSISNLEKNISDADDRLTDLKARMAEEEEQYWSKMTAMESALSTLNSQSTWLTAQFDAL
jgi:flagellar hook-associated protein 2